MGVILVTGSADKTLIEKGKAVSPEQLRDQALQPRFAEESDRSRGRAAVVTEVVQLERNVQNIQGDHYVSREADIVLRTVLGSCVAACLHDTHALEP